MSDPNPINNPLNGLDAVNHLRGVELENGWTVIEKIEKLAGGTGGHFSVCYKVADKKGRVAFLKALNLGLALQMSGDTLLHVQTLINSFVYERNAVFKCRDKRLSRIVTALDHGKFQPGGSTHPVFYIIFEIADSDVRKQITNLNKLDVAWILRILHQTTAALAQLHNNQIAHQDLKPSNVLLFEPKSAKVGDLGCADNKGISGPRSRFPVAGDISYAPPELLYSEIASDWDTRRLGCDLYLLGSLIVFLFTGVHMTTLLLNALPQTIRPGMYPHSYRNALPYVRDAFGETFQRIGDSIPQSLRDELLPIIEQLCEPDPRLRGHPNDRATAQFNLQRYVSIFDRLAKKAEHGLLNI